MRKEHMALIAELSLIESLEDFVEGTWDFTAGGMSSPGHPVFSQYILQIPANPFPEEV